jgi:3-oxoacyl-[acyl-carrier protein] reductase
MGMLDGRVALVTGGGRGVGRAVSELLAAEGATVAVNYRRDASAADATVKQITAAGGAAQAYSASVDDVEAVRSMVDAVVADFGFVDLLVNNAGVASRGRSVADTDPAEVERVIHTHAIGPHHVSQAVLPSMRSRPRGDIVMISSTATQQHVGNIGNGGPYNMGKAAMEALAFTLAHEEVGHNIRVNVVAPGLVDTDMGERLAKAQGAADIRDLDAVSPFGHVCQPIDVARVVLFFCSELAGYVTGQRLYVDGGGPPSNF